MVGELTVYDVTVYAFSITSHVNYTMSHSLVRYYRQNLSIFELLFLLNGHTVRGCTCNLVTS